MAKVKVIKRNEMKGGSVPPLSIPAKVKTVKTERQISETVKSWIDEFRENKRRRDEGAFSRLFA